MNTNLFLASAPLLLVFVLMVMVRVPSSKALIATWISTTLIAFFAWSVSLEIVISASLKGILITLELLLIVFGAILLLKIMQKSGAITVIDQTLSSVSKDRRVQVILIAWMMGNILEGAAGFGTPTAVAAPLLVAIGFPAIAAVTMAVLADGVAVSFGAMGTPIIYGLSSIPVDLAQVTTTTAFIHAILGTFIPLILVCTLTTYFGKGWKQGLEITPYAIWAGLCFTIPYYVTAVYLGSELPSVIGGIVGLIILVLTTRAGFLTPKKEWTFSPRPTWPTAWKQGHNPIIVRTRITEWKAYLPYVLLASLLLVTRLPAVAGALKRVTLNIPLGILSYNWIPLYSPTLVFLFVCIVAGLLYKLSLARLLESCTHSITCAAHPFITLAAAIGTAQIMINSGTNTAGLASMPTVIGTTIAGIGTLYIFIAPFIGIIGAFIAGSNTVSNLLFGSAQASAAQGIGLSVPLILALQTVGGGAGNLIAVYNIITASATTGLHGTEGTIMRMNLLPVLLYGIAAGIIGWLLI